jgi:catechol 2,3-dioxygenase-like lactoylglutathione lyase family enzyme
MGTRRISHIVLYVPDPQRAVKWYDDLLGLVPKYSFEDAVFTQFDASDNDDDHDLAFFKTGGGGQRSGPWNSRFEEQPANVPTAGLYHISYQVETQEQLYEIKAELERQGRLGNVHDDEAEGGFKRVYGTDPDGLLFEVSWVPPLKKQLELEKKKAPQVPPDPAAQARRRQEGEAHLRAAHEQREAQRKLAQAK